MDFEKNFSGQRAMNDGFIADSAGSYAETLRLSDEIGTVRLQFAVPGFSASWGGMPAWCGKYVSRATLRARWISARHPLMRRLNREDIRNTPRGWIRGASSTYLNQYPRPSAGQRDNPEIPDIQGGRPGQGSMDYRGVLNGSASPGMVKYLATV